MVVEAKVIIHHGLLAHDLVVDLALDQPMMHEEGKVCSVGPSALAETPTPVESAAPSS